MGFFVKNKFSYHNRLREKQFIDIFTECGAKIVWLENRIDPDDVNYLKNIKIDKAFQGMSYEELAVTYSEIIIAFE